MTSTSLDVASFGLLSARAVLQPGLVRTTIVEDIRLTVLSSRLQLRERSAGSSTVLPCALYPYVLCPRVVGDLVVPSFPLLPALKLVSPVEYDEFKKVFRSDLLPLERKWSCICVGKETVMLSV